MILDSSRLLQISSLTAWYDATDLETIDAVDGIVREWLDKSRNGWDLRPSASLGLAATPVYAPLGIYGLPAISFNGTSPYLRSINPFAISGKDARSIFVVAAGGSVTRPGSVVHWGAAERSRAYGISLEENIVLYRWSDNMFLATNDLVTPALISGTYDGKTHKAWLNGYLATQDNHEIDTASTEIQIGGRGTNMYPGVFCGVVGEVLIFDRAVSDNERVFIEGTLAWKWQLEQYLPPIHAFSTVSPAEAAQTSRLQ